MEQPEHILPAPEKATIQLWLYRLTEVARCRQSHHSGFIVCEFMAVLSPTRCRLNSRFRRQ
jgi:hypothetical protein